MKTLKNILKSIGTYGFVALGIAIVILGTRIANADITSNYWIQNAPNSLATNTPGGLATGDIHVAHCYIGLGTSTQCSSGGSATIAIGGTITSGTSGSVLFVNPTATIAQNNNNFYFNNSSSGLATNTNVALSVNTGGDFTGTDAINVYGQYDAYLPNSAITNSLTGLNTDGAVPAYGVSSSRGTGTSPVQLNSGDLTGGFFGFGSEGASSPTYQNLGGMSIFATGSSTNNLGGELRFYTKGDGGTLTQQMSISNSGLITTVGNVAIGGSLTVGGSNIPTSVSNSNGTLTISPTTGAVVASLALGHANTWSALQTFGASANVSSGQTYQLNGVNMVSAQTSLFNYYFGNSGNITGTGQYNTAIGNNALVAVTNGTANMAIGLGALASNTSGGYNVAIGVNVISNNVSGSNNVGIGNQALQGVVSNSFSNNVGIGYFAGQALTTGGSNVFLGYYAGSNVTTDSNSFYLNNIQQTTLANDKAFSLLYGTFSGTAGSTTGQQLTVNGALNTTTLAVTGGGTSFTASGNAMFSNAVTVSGFSTLGGGFGTGAGTATNFAVNSGSSISSASSATGLLFGGASSVQYRALFNGSTSTTLSTGTSYANNIFGATPVTTFTSGTHALLANLVVNPIGTVTNTGATVTNTASLYINGAGTGGTNNFSSWTTGLERHDGLFNFNNVTGTANQIPVVNSGATAMTWTSFGSLQTTLITGTPTIAAGAGAGTSPTVSVTTNGKQLQVTVTTGTLPTGTNATVATVTLPNALTYTPYPVFSSASASTALLNGASMVYMTSTGSANVTITSGTTALTAATTYVWNISI